MISIIVPIYNAELHLERCIESILLQTYTDFELLLIDDGSTDSSGVICDKYAGLDSRVRVFHKENGGASSARNKGLDNAQGEWVTFVDGDDYVYKTYLENFSAHFQDKVDLICQGMAFDRVFSIRTPLTQFGIEYYGGIQDGLLELYKNPMPGSLCNKCFKSRVMKENGLRLDENVVLKEDEIFVLNYLRHCNQMASSREIGYFYFLPHWDEKYREIANGYIVAKEIYYNQFLIFKKSWNKILFDSLQELTKQFIILFARSHEKRKLILDYRRCTQANVLRTKLFFISKWLIYLDKTGYLSSLFLKVHIMMKTNK